MSTKYMNKRHFSAFLNSCKDCDLMKHIIIARFAMKDELTIIFSIDDFLLMRTLS